MRRSRSPRSREELAHEAVLLDKQGTSVRAISRSLGVARKTVTKLLEQHAAERAAPSLAFVETHARAPRPSKLDGHREAMAGLLERFPEITAQRVFEEIRLLGFAGGYTAVKDLVRKVRPKPKPEPSRPTTVYGPGEMSECDWSPYTIPFTHAPARTLQAFGYALNHSHRKYFGFYSTNDLHALMDGHVKAFAHFEGAAKETKYDSQKPVVLRWEGNQPIYNLRFVDFATFYEFRGVACRRGHPNDKPKVERSFWELERSFFNGREFRDEDDLAAQLRWWMANVSDQRPHKKAKRAPLEMFVAERPALQTLPAHSYDTARVVYRLCDIEGFLAWDGNRYSLPYEHVTDILPVRITQREIYVYAADLRLIARHELWPKGLGKDVELPGHHPRNSARGADLDQLRRAFEEMGPAAPGFLSALESARPRSAAYHARHILALRQRYDTLDVLKALAHAQRFGALDHSAIERILLTRATPRGLDVYVASKRVEALLGEPQTLARDLTEYDALPCWGSSSAQGGVICPDAAAATEVRPPSPPSQEREQDPEAP